MNQSLTTAFLVLFIGMLTVFVVLCLVVATGRILIYLVNKFGPAIPAKIEQNDFSPLLMKTSKSETDLQKKKLAAIISTIDIVTQGKGKIVGIDKIKPSK